MGKTLPSRLPIALRKYAAGIAFVRLYESVQTNDMSDSEIAAELRPILAKTKERAAMAEVAERLRHTADPVELAERDRSGNRMAELDLEICQMSVAALDHIGLWHAAGMIEQALEQPRR